MYDAQTNDDRRDLRRKFQLNPQQTDRELYHDYPAGDLWPDANLGSVLVYVYKCKFLNIPESWRGDIEAFLQQFQ